MFERLYTMTGYHDGPLDGIADFEGTPHAYARRFDRAADDYGTLYELRPVDAETLALALEDWEIWLRWEDAFRANATTIETHPALPADRARHDEIAPLLDARLDALPRPPIVATATFRPAPGHADGGRGRSMQVEWTRVESSN